MHSSGGAIIIGLCLIAHDPRSCRADAAPRPAPPSRVSLQVGPYLCSDGEASMLYGLETCVGGRLAVDVSLTRWLHLHAAGRLARVSAEKTYDDIGLGFDLVRPARWGLAFVGVDAFWPRLHSEMADRDADGRGIISGGLRAGAIGRVADHVGVGGAVGYSSVHVKTEGGYSVRRVATLELVLTLWIPDA